MDPSMRFQTEQDTQRYEESARRAQKEAEQLRERLERERMSLPSRIEEEDVEDVHERAVMDKVQTLLGRRWMQKQEEEKEEWEQYEDRLYLKKQKQVSKGESKKERHRRKKEEIRLKKEKKRKEKKEKHRKKKHHDEEKEQVWVEKGVADPSSEQVWVEKGDPSAAVTMERQSWMISAPQRPPSPERNQEVSQREPTISEQRELNPFRKSGSLGVPTKEGELVVQKQKIKLVGDGGRSWKERALKRAKECQAGIRQDVPLVPRQQQQAGAGERSLFGGQSMRAPERREWGHKSSKKERHAPKPPPSRSQEEEDVPAKPKQDANLLAAQILKAKMAGNAELVRSLQQQVMGVEEEVEQRSKRHHEEEVVVVDVACYDRYGRAIRQVDREEMETTRSGKRLKKMKTHGEDGERERYFRDDDMDLKTMVARERAGGASNPDMNMAQNIAHFRHFDGIDEDFDDVYGARMLDKGEEYMPEQHRKKKERRRAIAVHKETTRITNSCAFCLDGDRGRGLSHTILSSGARMFLRMPEGAPMVPDHCVLVPKEHVTATVDVGEEVLDEMRNCKKMLQAMFAKEKRPRIPIFMEVAHAGRKEHHAMVEVFPIPVALMEDARIYFRKALLESDEEWAQHKKIIVTTRERRIERSVPRGFSYFNVEFGVNAGGFAHVIENEEAFLPYFGREILGGLLDIEPHRWRNPPKILAGETYQLVDAFKKRFHEYQKIVRFVLGSLQMLQLNQSFQ